MQIGSLKWGLLLLLLGSPKILAGADVTCTAADYKGVYAFSTNRVGWFLVLPPEGAILQGPFSQAGTFTTDGKGTVTIESFAGYNGLIQPANVTATYTITPDCVLTFDLTLPFGVPSQFTGVLSNGGRQMVLMITDPEGTVVVGHHLKQDLRFCGLADFSGAYMIEMRGVIASPSARAGLFSRLGRVVADGNGRFTAATIATYGGLPVEEDLSGTYEVSAKGIVTLRYTQNGENLVIRGALGGHGESVSVMMTSPGWTAGGILTRQ